MSEYTNNLNVVSTYKGEKSVSITGTFQCGIHFPKSGAKPFKVIERTSKNNKQYKQIACTVVISRMTARTTTAILSLLSITMGST